MAQNHLDDTTQISSTNYYPNSDSKAPIPQPQYTEPPLPILGEAWVKAYDTQGEDNFSQAGNLFRIMSQDQKQQLINNIAGGLVQANSLIQEKMLQQAYAADSEYGDMLKQALVQHARA